ncbi:MAG: hypothetical protein KDK34_08460 [Leptospiraceae bacterium]|nr:hypothetical protein [Leptospiraceae bacterium]
MQDKPEAADLMDAIQEFLMKEILPFVKERDDLSFKTLVSWNMLGVMAREFRTGEHFINAEFERLHALLNLNPDDPQLTTPDTYIEKMELCRQLNHKLAEQIRNGHFEGDLTPDHPIWQHVRETLRETLSVSNPRFSV